MEKRAQLSLHISKRYPGVEKDEKRFLSLMVHHWQSVSRCRQEQLPPLEKLEAHAAKNGILVDYVPISSNLDQKALYAKVRGTLPSSVIVLPKNVSRGEQAEILAEELAHHALSTGDIVCQKNHSNRKQEKIARDLAYQHLLPPQLVAKAINEGYTTISGIAFYTGHRPLFVEAALHLYEQKNLLTPYLTTDELTSQV